MFVLLEIDCVDYVLLNKYNNDDFNPQRRRVALQAYTKRVKQLLSLVSYTDSVGR